MRALVLDDNLAIGRLARAVAAPLGFAAELTSSGPEFRSRYKAELPDVILLDLQIGDSDVTGFSPPPSSWRAASG